MTSPLDMTARGREFFMSIVVAPGVPGPEQSFEELRVQDYLKAYTTTGRPPVPCPQEPTTESSRTALGLPRLFQPIPV
ncbi:hypothetical protein SERLA73DRAFT_133491, partial [Serpula lacrymans var. lacrymans S7.3]